jgi:type I restriction enzyme, S subunit
MVRVADLVRAGELRVDDGYRVTNAELGDGNGTPFVRGGDIRHDGSIDTNVQDHVLPEFYPRLGSKLARPGDVAFITKGTVGRVGFLRPGQPECVFSPQVCYWRSLHHTGLQPRFLYYLLSGREFQSNLDAVKTHGAMAADYVSISDQRSFRLTLPPPAEQLAIATVLGALDDKIELNRRTNETLEEMARALFKSWFVDFDPVYAKAAGKKPFGMDDGTATLFPSTFCDSVLGRIPGGWEVSTLGNCTALIIDHRGKTPTKLGGDWCESGLLAISARNVKAGRFVQMDSARYVDENLYSRWMPEELAPGDILLTSEAPLGELLYLAKKRSLCLSQRLYGIRAEPTRCSPAYLYLWLSSESVQAEMNSRATGSTVLGIRQSELRKVAVLLPDKRIAAKFQLGVHAILERLNASEDESVDLAALRDTLLPKLLSGELRIKDAERIVGEAT